MTIRSEINDLTANIRIAAKTYTGNDKISLDGVVTTITDLNKKIDKTINAYAKNEISLKGRAEIVQNLVDALNLLKNKAQNQIYYACSDLNLLYPDLTRLGRRVPNDDCGKDEIICNKSTLHSILQSIQKAEQIITAAKQKRSSLDKKIQQIDQTKINFTFDLDSLPEEKITQNTYRSLRNVKSDEQIFIKKTVDSSPYTGYLYLKKDLETFLTAYQSKLTEWQHSEIRKLILLLENGFEIDKKIFTSYLFPRGVGVPNDVLEANIADIMYEIETSIEKLEIGQSFIFPGGLDNNRYILYEIRRFRNDKYQFAIINTNSEAEFGQDFWQKVKLQTGFSNQARVPIFNNLPLSSLTDHQFLGDLLRFQTTTGIPNLMETVYKTILNQLTQKYPGEQSVRELHDVQAWGPTSFDPILAYVEYALPPSLYIPFQYDMMLRARKDLNKLLPIGKEQNIFDKETLDFIDKKSCKTISEWQQKFKKHCTPTEDLAIAKQINDAKVTNQKDFKEYLEKLTGEFEKLNNAQELIPEQVHLRDQMASDLLGYEKLFEKISPQVIATLKNRRETLLPQEQSSFFSWFFYSKNRACLANLDLQPILEYLTDRFSEISMCAPLLNVTANPLLCEAFQGCKMLAPPAV